MQLDDSKKPNSIYHYNNSFIIVFILILVLLIFFFKLILIGKPDYDIEIFINKRFSADLALAFRFAVCYYEFVLLD